MHDFEKFTVFSRVHRRKLGPNTDLRLLNEIVSGPQAGLAESFGKTSRSSDIDPIPAGTQGESCSGTVMTKQASSSLVPVLHIEIEATSERHLRKETNPNFLRLPRTQP